MPPWSRVPAAPVAGQVIYFRPPAEWCVTACDAAAALFAFLIQDTLELIDLVLAQVRALKEVQQRRRDIAVEYAREERAALLPRALL